MEREEPNVNVEVEPPRRRTRDRLSKYERARIIAMRSEQIANGAPTFVNRVEGDEPMDVAEREFAAGRIPFTIRRRVPTPSGDVYELWKLSELKPCDRRLAHRPKDHEDDGEFEHFDLLCE